MFYPQIIRRKQYKSSSLGTPFADYRVYYDEISEDCDFRCVYCDILLRENGGEGMHLDHFRPQKLFPELSKSPENLVLACPKCNLLKSDYWPNENLCSSHFIDPFKITRSDHFKIIEDGKVYGLSSQSDYMITILSLNRLSRCAVRKMRTLKREATQLIAHIEIELLNLDTTSPDFQIQQLHSLASALKEIRLMLDEL